MRLTGSVCVIAIFVFSACAPKSMPYDNGPVMSQKTIRKTFQPILQFMEYKSGMSFADVGAGSGAITVMMATLMDNSTVYIQDIDTSVLKQDNLVKIIDYYSNQTGQDLRKKTDFNITIGDTRKTKLPDRTFDLIYSNGTLHTFSSLDLMLADLSQKLKPDGVIYFRDSFKNDHGEKGYCSDTKCGKPLLTIDKFMSAMKKNGFQIKKQSPDMSGYPVFGFTLASSQI